MKKIWKREHDLPDICVYLEESHSEKVTIITDEIGIPSHVIDFIANKLIGVHKLNVKGCLDSIHITDSKSELGKLLRTAGIDPKSEERGGLYIKEHNVIAIPIDLPKDDSGIVSHDYENGCEYIDWEEKLILIFGHELYHFIHRNQISVQERGTEGHFPYLVSSPILLSCPTRYSALFAPYVAI